MSNRIGWSAYLGQAPGGPAVSAYAAPARREDLSGLCPAWIGTGDIELFADEDRAYGERLAAAGVACELDVVRGGPHAFESFALQTSVAQAYMARATEWLRRRPGD